MPAKHKEAHKRSARDDALSHHGLLILFTFFWGANFILAELALRQMSAIAFSVSRFAMGGVAMLVVFYIQYRLDVRNKPTSHRFLPSIDQKDWPRLLLISIIGATLAPWLGIEGLGLTNGARASLWLALGPALSTGFGYFFSTERIGFYGFAGVILAGVGTIILAIDGMQPQNAYWFGDLLLITALVLTVIELHLIKPLARKYGSISMVTLRTMIGGTFYLLIAAPSLIKQPWFSLNIWTWVAILAGGGVGVGLGQWVKVRALHKLGPTKVVLYGNMVPIAALLIAWLSIGENPEFLELIAAACIVSGAILIQVIDGKSTNGDIVSSTEDPLPETLPE